MLNEYEIFRQVAAQTMSREEALMRLRELAAGTVPEAGSSPGGETVPGMSPEQGETEVKQRLIGIIGGLLHIPEGEFAQELSFKDMGVDSINGVEIVRDINAAFQTNLDAVALYDYSTLPALALRIHEDVEKGRRAYAIAREASGTGTVPPAGPVSSQHDFPHSQAGTEAISEAEEFPSNKKMPVAGEARSVPKLKLSLMPNRPAALSVAGQKVQAEWPMQIPEETRKEQDGGKGERTSRAGADVLDIAVIGMAGRFPGADTVDQLWDNLQNAVNPIGRVPAGRWTGKQYDGGFLNHIDRFDPLFFNLTPLEAESMDPQHRIFLEETWRAFEDAGYTTSMLDGVRCGVFVGAAQGDYREILRERGLDQTGYAFTGLNTFMLTGRISYALNLNGPNMAIDCACSSSLVAIHQACASLASGESEMAVAGGIRLILTPDMHMQIEDMELLSHSASCRSFDRDADGLVLSEGAGVIVLKPLAAAIRDQDYIYGVIKGSGVNQDGHSNGITAPSAQAQTQLETDVYERFGIRPERIGLVEGNGTGTPLGDSIEFKAIRDAFRKYTDRKQFCALGTIKASIGHTTMAAGVTGVIKALLSFKHGIIPPMPNFQQGNEMVSLGDSPFFINNAPLEWKVEPGVPRMAAVSSFGLSGTNAHLVLEEAPAEALVSANRTEFPYYLFPLSAKTAGTLSEKVAELAEWLLQKGRLSALGDIAYTLSAGRNHYAVRTAFVAATREELAEQLKSSLLHDHAFREIDRKSGMTAVHRELCGRLVAELPATLGNGEVFKEKLDVLAELYQAGVDVDWRLVYASTGCRRIPLPAYPFARTLCWSPRQEPAGGAEAAAEQQEAGRLHPYISRNTSTLRMQKYTTDFGGSEQIFADHRVQGSGVLPGVVYLEMARAGAEAAGEAEVAGLENILWSSPVTDDAPCQVHTALYPDSEGHVDFEIYSLSSGEMITHSQGRVVFKAEAAYAPQEPQNIDLPAARLRCSTHIDQKLYYASLAQRKLEFGPSLRAIRSMELGENEAVAELDLGALEGSRAEGLPYPIALMDAAFETVAGLMSQGKSGGGQLYLPFALDSLDFIESVLPSSSFVYAYAEKEKDGQGENMRRFTMLLVDGQGKVLVRFRNFTVRAFEEQSAGHSLLTV